MDEQTTEGLLGMAAKRPDLSQCVNVDKLELWVFETYRCSGKGLFYKFKDVIWDATEFRLQIVIWALTAVIWILFMRLVTDVLQDLPEFYRPSRSRFLIWIVAGFSSLVMVPLFLERTYAFARHFFALTNDVSVWLRASIWSIIWILIMIPITSYLIDMPPPQFLIWIATAFSSLLLISFSLNGTYTFSRDFLELSYEGSVALSFAIWSLAIAWIWFRISESHK
jgi:hypothetical protein